MAVAPQAHEGDSPDCLGSPRASNNLDPNDPDADPKRKQSHRNSVRAFLIIVFMIFQRFWIDFLGFSTISIAYSIRLDALSFQKYFCLFSLCHFLYVVEFLETTSILSTVLFSHTYIHIDITFFLRHNLSSTSFIIYMHSTSYFSNFWFIFIKEFKYFAAKFIVLFEISIC